jgi:ribosome recycling factor
MAATADEAVNDTESRMKKAVEAASNDFASVRTGRASASLLDRLQVDSYGQMVPLKQVAGVSVPDARTISISAWDRGQVGAIRKAIETSDLGLTPNVDGSTIRLSIPPLNEERRKELVKIVRKKAEAAKVGVRNVRQKGIDEIKALQKNHAVTEDEQKRAADKIQKLTDRFIKEVDALVEHKEREIMEV